MGRSDGFDVVVVGGGIAGGAVATALARGGLTVLVMERSTEYKDRVRGEFLTPWGVLEAQRLGLLPELLEAGANPIESIHGYDEVCATDQAGTAAIPLNDLLPGVAGGLGIGHPNACTALAAAAEKAGATVVRGVSDVSIHTGSAPSIDYRTGDESHHAECRLIVGADGTDSTIRRQLGIDFRSTEPRVFLGGMLVDGVRGWDPAGALIGTEGDRMFYAFPQTRSLVRLYLGVRVEERQRLSGADRVANTLEGFQLRCLPPTVDLAGATPVGPCAAYAMHDTWTATVCVEGAVLIGDAAGQSDPVMFQGLAVALRDARSVAEALLGESRWSPGTFSAYGIERAERMRRLRFAAQLFTDGHLPARPGDETRHERMKMLNGGDAEVFLTQACAMTGPETAPEECFSVSVRTRLLAAR